MNAWKLPQSAVIGGKQYGISSDFRDVLEIIGYLTDTKRDSVVAPKPITATGAPHSQLRQPSWEHQLDLSLRSPLLPQV